MPQQGYSKDNDLLFFIADKGKVKTMISVYIEWIDDILSNKIEI
jgi:hypothetical protein